MSHSVPPRSDVPHAHTWNAESVFATPADWEAEVQALLADLPAAQAFAGHLGDSPSALFDALEKIYELGRRAYRVMMYAGFTYAVDTTNQESAGRAGRAQGVMAQVMAALAFVDPELIALGEAHLAAWQTEHPPLQRYAQRFHDLFRQQAHVRSAEVEELLGSLGEVFGSIEQTAGLLTDADFKFPTAHTTAGETREVTQSSLHTYLGEADRVTRRTAWEGYFDTYLAHKNTLANNLLTSIKANVFLQRARRHTSTLSMSLFENNVPEAVFHNLINTFKANLPTWHRYWEVRRRALNLPDLHPYDVWAPLTATRPTVTWDQAVEWVCAGMAPLGEAYVSVMRRGLTEQRWVDWQPNQGKRGGAFSWGTKGTHPFIMMSFDNSLFAVSTLAHELGHSMHSYFTWQNQPNVYAGYSLFVAEVASNFNQALVRAHLLRTQTDPVFQINLLEEAMYNFHRYFFQMPTLARFELEVHQRVEQGKPVTADSMIDLMADLFTEGYGGQVQVDRARVGMTWATFAHLYADYYVYQYATGISAAHALAAPILAGQAGAAEAYINFLKSGSAAYGVEVLKQAGVDMTQPDAVTAAFGTLADYVSRLETLVTA